MNTITCNVIKDLLPLYYDKVCSTDTIKIIEEHLRKCKNCKEELNIIKNDFKINRQEVIENNAESNYLKIISKKWTCSKLKAFFIGAGIVTTMVILYICLRYWNIVNMPIQDIEISNISQLESGVIVYHVKVKNGYQLDEFKFHRQNGNVYVIPRKPIINRKVKYHPGLANMYYDFYEHFYNKNINALYFGTPEDNILIWKKGMKLPNASEEIEKEFDYLNKLLDETLD